MPQDPNLYGQRPAKKQKKEIPLSSSLAFTSQLTSLLSSSSSSADPSTTSYTAPSTSSGRARPSKTKDDLFRVRPKRKAAAPAETADPTQASSKQLELKSPRGTDAEARDRARTRRVMQEKARRYAALQRGDAIARDGGESAPLVDFDRKWAERHPEEHGDGDDRLTSSGEDAYSEDDDDDDADAMVEYTDGYGRTRTLPRREALRQRRADARRALGAAEVEGMRARPRAPDAARLIRGDAVQSGAFAPSPDAAARMAALAARRDRTPTPPADAHFDGAAEGLRAKGVGYYRFAGEAAARARQMAALAAERRTTEAVRGAREAERARGRREREREREERRQRLGRRRAEMLAGRFLEGLAGEVFGAGADGGDGGGEGETEGEKEKGKEKEEDKKE
ncbi:hypothetical protein F4780DRAFT_774380 [Xylariomycetidae sp. FL0641]|nr:hypothetical protein F4780DRAFT_774380 [Xylariomycetidae sp. FL0641]